MPKPEIGKNILSKLPIGNRFDFTSQYGVNTRVQAEVRDIHPPIQENDPPDLKRYVTVYVPRLDSEITLAGDTLVYNWGSSPTKKSDLPEESRIRSRLISGQR